MSLSHSLYKSFTKVKITDCMLSTERLSLVYSSSNAQDAPSNFQRALFQQYYADCEVLCQLHPITHLKATSVRPLFDENLDFSKSCAKYHLAIDFVLAFFD